MKSSSIELAILELFEIDTCHFKANEVYQHLNPRFPAVNRSTIYRALERLARNGKVSVSDIGTGAAVYQRVSDGKHHHLVCQKCCQVQTIEHDFVGAFFAQIEGRYDFKVDTNHLVLFGECAACKQSTPSPQE